MAISKEEFADWVMHPVTRALRERWEADVQRLKDAWARGEYAKDRETDSKVRGQVELLTQFLSLDLEDIEME